VCCSSSSWRHLSWCQKQNPAQSIWHRPHMNIH
jgi:hypothetical protein